MPSFLTRFSLICSLTLMTACGGRSPADLQRTIGYTPQVDTQGQVILDLASQNRLSMQQNKPFSYRYISPTAERATESSTENIAAEANVPAQAQQNAAAPPAASLSKTPASSAKTPTPVQNTAAPAKNPEATTRPRQNGPQIGDFALEDLQGERRRFQFPREKLLVLAIADQKGSEGMENWIKPLYDRYSSRIDIEGVAELSAVPGFARGIARGIISGLVKQPILLDWTGEVSQQLKAQKNITNLYVIDAQGQLIASSSGEATLEKLKEMVEAIDSAL